MSGTSLPTTQPPGPTITITLTPSPTTIFTTNRITFSTIISFATVTETSIIIQTSSPPPLPPPPEPPKESSSSPLDTNFVILISLTAAIFLLLLILIIILLFFLRRRRKERMGKRTESSPPLTSFPPLPLPPTSQSTPQLPPPSTFSPLFLTPPTGTQPQIQMSERPITAPPQRPRRSNSTPFLGPEYENKGFIFQPEQQPQTQAPTATTALPSSWRLPHPQLQLQPQTQTQTPPIDRPPFTPTNPHTTHGVGSWFEINPIDVPGLEHEQEAQEQQTLSQIQLQMQEEEIEIESAAGRKDSKDSDDQRKETFDFFRFPIAGQAQGTRASSGVFPDVGDREG